VVEFACQICAALEHAHIVLAQRQRIELVFAHNGHVQSNTKARFSYAKAGLSIPRFSGICYAPAS
jgi:hypothetical protein